LGFSTFASVFFSGLAGDAGVAGVADLAWAKLDPAKARITRDTRNNLEIFFIESSFQSLDAGL
jgi:hypothetical protein